MKLLNTSTLASLVLFSSLSFAATKDFTDIALWDAQFSNVYIEDFEDDNFQSPFESITAIGGNEYQGTLLGTPTTFTDFRGFKTITETDGSSNRVWDDRLDEDKSTLIEFSSAVNGFGGIWDLTPNNSGMGITFITSTGEEIGLEVPNYYDGQFWGFTTDSSFTSLRLISASQGGVSEDYTLDNVRFGTVSAVPEPSALALFAGGLGLIGFMAARRRKHQ